MKMSDFCLDKLPLDVWLLIFEYCTVFDLGRFSRTCKFFYEIISTNEVFWTKKSKKVLVTNQMSERFRERCNPLLLSSRDKCIISQHWQRKIKYKKNVHEADVYLRENSRSCLQMTKDILWWSCRNMICGFKRTGNCITASDICYKEIFLKRQSYRDNFNLYKFILCNDEIISTYIDGSMRKLVMKQEEEDGKKTNRLHVIRTYLDESLISDVDATSQYIISSHLCYGFHEIKMRKNINESEESVCYKYKKVFPTQIMSLAIDPAGTKLVAGYENENAICIFNINSAQFKLYKTHKLQPLLIPSQYPGITEGIIWEDHHTFLICDDVYMTKWDLRARDYVHFWSIPNRLHKLKCISSDYQYTIMTGAAEGMIYVWDQRLRNHVTSYNLLCNVEEENAAVAQFSFLHENNVDSLQFDSNHVYATVNGCLHEINFAEQVKQKFELSELDEINISGNTTIIS